MSRVRPGTTADAPLAAVFAALLLASVPAGAAGQPVTIDLGVPGGSLPFGDALSGLDAGGVAEVSARYHLPGSPLALGAGYREGRHGGTPLGGSLSVRTAFLEARWIPSFSGPAVRAGRRLHPYLGARVGWTERERLRAGAILPVEDAGWAVEPRAGIQYWYDPDLAVAGSLGLQLGSYGGEFGGAALGQLALVVGL